MLKSSCRPAGVTEIFTGVAGPVSGVDGRRLARLSHNPPCIEEQDVTSVSVVNTLGLYGTAIVLTTSWTTHLHLHCLFTIQASDQYIAGLHLDANMFFEGTLQEGIASAVQQAKLVVCFVTGTMPYMHSCSQPRILM